MEIRIIESGSQEYRELVKLRIKALLDPIGVPPSYIEPEKEKNDIFIGAFQNYELIGCCVLTKKNDAMIQLRQMAVLPEHRLKKIGVAIIRFAEEKSKEEGYSVLMMHARDVVLDFYIKCGYEIVGEQFFEVGIGHHVMEKKLKG